MHHIVIFNGSARKGQYTQHVTQLVKTVIEENKELTVQVVDPRDFSLTLDNEGRSASPEELTALVEAADAYIIVTPEYNHSFPGSLKYLLDLNLKQYIHKPVMLVGVSSGPWGGTRAIENLLPVLREIGMLATFTDVNVTNVSAEVNEKGDWTDEEKWRARIEKSLTELLWMTKTLTYGRENIPSQYHEKTS